MDTPICGLCEGPITEGQQEYGGKHRYLPDCLVYLRHKIKVLEQLVNEQAGALAVASRNIPLPTLPPRPQIRAKRVTG